MINNLPLRLKVFFYMTGKNNEPVREWLKKLAKEDKKAIGEDIKTVQFGWPIGMPVVKKIARDLWEIRSRIKDGIARILFTVIDHDKLVLLHGFIKKTDKIPQNELELAQRRLKELLS